MDYTGLVSLVYKTMEVLYRLAEPQAGYVIAAQAVAAGVSHRTLLGRERTGDLERVHHGIYRLRRYPAHPFEDVLVACLWAGPDCAASHETALAIFDISDAMPATIHITAPKRFRGRQRGVVVHHAPLSAGEREVRNGVPVTTIARTLQDVASDPDLVRQAVEQAIRRGVLSGRQLRRLVRDVPAIAPLVVDALAEDR